MKTSLISSIRTTALLSALLLAPTFAGAKEAPASDSAAQLLTNAGSVPIQAAGPYVEVGTFRIQVSTKLGRPSATLADGTWLYREFNVDGSTAAGTLVVRFDHGRVAQLSLVTPRVETAMIANSAKTKTLVAAK